MLFAECQMVGTRQSVPFAECSWGHSAKSVPIFLKECLPSASPPTTRQSGNFVFLNTMECGLGFRFKKKGKNLCRVPRSVTRQTGSPSPLPSVRVWHSAKKWFAECLPAGTRQTWTAGDGRYLTPFFAERQSLPSALHSAKRTFAECLALPSAWHLVKPSSLPSVYLCRVRHSAK